MIDTPKSTIDTKDVPIKADEKKPEVDSSKHEVGKDEEITLKNDEKINK